MWGDKLKKGLRDAGEKVGRLTKRGKLEMERMEAESELRRRHQDLGKHLALRMLEKGETEVLRGDPHVRQLLDSVARAQKALESIQDETALLKDE